MPLRALLLALALACAGAHAESVYLEDLTSAELRDAIRAGTTTAILCAGGTEQNGPHMTLGKHNARVRVLAGRIATALGHGLELLLVAAVVADEDDVLEAMLHEAARRAVERGAKRLVGNRQRAGEAHVRRGRRDAAFGHVDEHRRDDRVAERLNRDWARAGARAHYIAEYYRASQEGVAALLRARGLSAAQVGTHAGAADTALQLAVAPETVRGGQLAQAAREGAAGGVAGDPQAASAALGQEGADLIVTRSTAAIRAALGAARH